MSATSGIRKRFLSTVLMTDIVGSTEHAAELGDSGWRDLVQMHHALVRAALRRHGGREIDTAGDGFFAVFDAPAAAVDCALEVANRVQALGIEIRAGVHVGEVEEIAGKVGGITVPIASRIMSAAAAGEVLVSATVRDLAAGSGLTFEDRGIRQLKGVPGEWHVFAVGLAEPEADGDGRLATAQERRAAAVRWSEARPFWQRHPRLTIGTAGALAVLLATSGLLVWRPWQPPALANVSENSIGVIDPDRNELIGQIQVGTRPGGIAVSEGYAWVTNSGDDTVSQVDLGTGSVVNRIDVGRAPKGIAVAEGSVWVANSGDRTVSRINIATGRAVGEPLDVGNGPSAIAASGALLWVANSTDSTVVSIDPRTGAIGPPTAVAAGPIAVAVDESGLWVASEDAASVSHLDPVSGVATAAPIQLAARPSALAVDADSAWVASADGTVTQIDRAANRVTSTTDVHSGLTAIVISDDSIWVGDHDGTVFRLDAADPSSPPKRISTSRAIASLAVVDGAVWLAAQASAASHRGGTLRIVMWEPPRYEAIGLLHYANDPLSANSLLTASLLEADGLVGYRRVGGTAGSTLLPDLATSVPRPTNAGKTYIFQVRPNLVYSTGDPVRPADFRRAAERSFQVDGGGGAWGNLVFPKIAGAEACATDDWSAVERCDLSVGIRTDDGANTVTFNLSEPDPDFVYKLAHPAAYPVPEGVPMDKLLDGEAFPGTGPYVVTATTDTELRLARNPNFHVWDAAVRPDGFADEILFTVVQDDASRVAMVENGEADYTSFRIALPSPELRARLRTQYPGQWHVAGVGTAFVIMNTSMPPFDSPEARRAVNFAIDRGAMAQADETVTCQLLPPGFPGFQPYCPYTVDPDAGGQWKAPDLAEAQRLVTASGTRGAAVVVGPGFPTETPELEYLGSVLENLGFQVSVDNDVEIPHIIDVWGSGRTQVTLNAWGPDYLWPSNFLGLFTCGGEPTGILNYCNPNFDAAFKHASELQATDPAAAIDEWTALDHRAVDLALLAPTTNGGADFVSSRVGNYQYHPSDVALFDQMWVQ
jgi:peptide/nickel transport system substrate-binding protein